MSKRFKPPSPSHDPEEREYPDVADQLREVLIHGNYLSQKDIEICFACDLTSLKAHANFQSIAALHQSLHDTYSDSEPLDATSTAAIPPTSHAN